jgi:hypothetical protein
MVPIFFYTETKKDARCFAGFFPTQSRDTHTHTQRAHTYQLYTVLTLKKIWCRSFSIQKQKKMQGASRGFSRRKADTHTHTHNVHTYISCTQFLH